MGTPKKVSEYQRQFENALSKTTVSRARDNSDVTDTICPGQRNGSTYLLRACYMPALILLDLITAMASDEGHKLQSSSLYRYSR
jgi:hypothetical protein